MTNSEKFKDVFGLYATELWAMQQEDFLNWINTEYKESESVQPEIVRCKDCRYSEYDQIFHNRYCHNKMQQLMMLLRGCRCLNHTEVSRMYDTNTLKIIANAMKDTSWIGEGQYQRLMNMIKADGCMECAFENMEEWEMPCVVCKRNCKDYYRKPAE